MTTRDPSPVLAESGAILYAAGGGTGNRLVGTVLYGQLSMTGTTAASIG